jgi:hypothetical protein
LKERQDAALTALRECASAYRLNRDIG